MKPVKSLNLSDLHLGHRRLDPELMVRNLISFILSHLEGVDLLNLQGDLFDTAVGLSDESSTHIIRFIGQLLKQCSDRNITVRIMRGTFSHDRRQVANVPVIHEMMGCTNDLKYFDTISLEHIERFDMRVLYIPDNVPYESSDAVMEEVRRQMEAMGWDSVDYAHVHGYFSHVVPDAAHDLKIVFREEQFGFVKRFVNVGHVHQHSMHNNIIYNGSTDRLAHNEEESKGMVLIDDRVIDASITFLENPQAMIFKTFDYSAYDAEDKILDLFMADIADLPTERPKYLRIIHPRMDVRQAIGQYLKIHHPLVRYSHSKGSETKNASRNEDVIIPRITPDQGAITEENLPQVVLAYLENKKVSHGLTHEDIVDFMRAS